MTSFRYIPATAEPIPGARRPVASDHQLSALAALHRDVQTKRHAALALAHNGFASRPAAIDALIARIADQLRQRRQRAWLRIVRRLGHQPKGVLSPEGSTTQTLPIGTPQLRLKSLRQRAVEALARRCLRHGAAGGSSFAVTLTDNPAEVGYRVEMGSNRDTYAGQYKGWSAAEDHHQICVPADWRVRVQRRGLAVAGGMLTLDLQQLAPAGDVVLYAAAWVSQGRGYAVNVHRGVIAVFGDEVYHAADLASALRGVRLKRERASRTPESVAEQYAQGLDAFVARNRKHAHLTVKVDDARAIGACEYGIRSWCEAVGIDLAQGEVTLDRVLTAYRTNPLVEARRTVLHVVAKSRAEQRHSRAVEHGMSCTSEAA